jgi:hypothetical protein
VAEVQKMAMRGLRLKVGIATGPVMDYISPATARIMYRGRVMNWAARISHLATGGQVGALMRGSVVGTEGACTGCPSPRFRSSCASLSRNQTHASLAPRSKQQQTPSDPPCGGACMWLS